MYWKPNWNQHLTSPAPLDHKKPIDAEMHVRAGVPGETSPKTPWAADKTFELSRP